ncbi:MAG: heparan-alpha-glucosaminide N-acetyltransferase domain-containing protein [Terracidiphilus sp.]|jgi:predicted acyltransferase
MTNPALASTPVQRLLSLDVLRGITIAFMIMVNNNGGSGSWGFMNHAAWNGLTPTDLVFPTFVFVVGASIIFAFDARLARGATRASVVWHTVRRAGILFLLGVVVNGFPFFKLDHLRIYGVLQRIAFCYLAVGLFYLWDKRVWTKMAAIGALLAGYWILLRWVPVPGAGTPGRGIPFLDPDRNLVAWLDRQIFPYHLYEDWTTHNLRDPEGLLSNLPAAATALIGLLAGLWLRSGRAAKAKTVGLAVGAAACLASGYLWSLCFPLNKKMWTSSYVLVAAGWSLVLLTVVYWAVEQKGWRKGWTWVWLVFGSNAIVAYMVSELLPSALDSITVHAGGPARSLREVLAAPIFAHIPNPGWAAFAYSVSFTAVCFVPVWALYRKKIFVKV